MINSGSAKLAKTANLLREAIPKMSQLNIPLTPKNYHTWYEYTMGSSQDLNEAIDNLLNNGEKFTGKVNNELYNTYISTSQDESIKSFQQEIQNLVISLFEKVSGMTKTTQNFSSSLEKYNNVLQQDPDLETITSLITNLVDETGSVLESNQSMESMLESMGEEVDTLRDNLQTLNKEAFTDQLTEVPNRRAFDKKLEELFDNYNETGQVFCLLLMDIDHFKKFNDTHGHAVGDKVLKYVASVMKGSIKGDDMLARYGGEEFAVLLPCTNYTDAISVGNYVRKKVSDNKLVDSNDKNKSLGHVTISIGVAVNNAKDDDVSIVERADKALYLAKDKGRNLVMGEQDL